MSPMNADAHALSLLREPLHLGRGQRAKSVRYSYAGDLTVEDLLKASTVSMGSKSPNVQELRQSHHTLARLLSQGLHQNEVAIIVGYSASRISILVNQDPAFAELLEYYRDMEQQKYAVARADMHARLAAVGFDSLEILHSRLLDAPDEFDNKTLLAVVEATADRTGHGKTSTVNHAHEHSLSSETINRLKTATSEGRPLAEADREALVRIAAERTALDNPEGEAADWIEGSRTLVREEAHLVPEAPVPEGDPELPQVDQVP